MSATTADLLGTIVAATERIVEVRAREVSVSDLERRCASRFKVDLLSSSLMC